MPNKDRLPKFQKHLEGIRYHCEFSAVERMEAGGPSASVAVLAPTFAMITASPLLMHPETWPARAVAAQ
eukprot:9105377-Pyramimonas_sp.AAC.1